MNFLFDKYASCAPVHPVDLITLNETCIDVYVLFIKEYFSLEKHIGKIPV